VHSELKTKGISLTSLALETVTEEAVVELAQGRDMGQALRIPQFQFGRDILRQRLFCRQFFKRFRFSSTKR
jgi:hypothetical protein